MQICAVKKSLVVLQRQVKVQSRDQVGGRDLSIRSCTTEVASCDFLTPDKGCDCVPCFSPQTNELRSYSYQCVLGVILKGLLDLDSGFAQRLFSG